MEATVGLFCDEDNDEDDESKYSTLKASKKDTCLGE